jgi:hypothetical protein
MTETKYLFDEKVGKDRWSARYTQEGGISVLHESSSYSCLYHFRNDQDWEELKAKIFGPSGPDANKMLEHASDYISAMP